MLICPVCLSPVERTERTLICPRGHSFDLARTGYVNFMKTKHPGDTREMLDSRRRFLDRGHYDRIGQHVSECAASHLDLILTTDHSETRNLVDAGCGEGHYLGMVQSLLRSRGHGEVAYLGIDSSRDACRLAAQRYQNAHFAVSDLKDFIPVADGSIHLLLDIFAPRSPTEFQRVLAPDGLVIVVIPQPHHLAELLSSFPLIGIEGNKAEHVVTRFEPLLQLVERAPIEYQRSLPPEDVVDLVGMSPSHRHLTAPLPIPLGPLTVTIAVEVLTFRSESKAYLRDVSEARSP